MTRSTHQQYDDDDDDDDDNDAGVCGGDDHDGVCGGDDDDGVCGGDDDDDVSAAAVVMITILVLVLFSGCCLFSLGFFYQ